jgi:hypothetical protein
VTPAAQTESATNWLHGQHANGDVLHDVPITLAAKKQRQSCVLYSVIANLLLTCCRTQATSLNVISDQLRYWTNCMTI